MEAHAFIPASHRRLYARVWIMLTIAVGWLISNVTKSKPVSKTMDRIAWRESEPILTDDECSEYLQMYI